MIINSIYSDASYYPHPGVLGEGDQLGRGNLPGGGNKGGQFLDQLGHYDWICLELF